MDYYYASQAPQVSRPAEPYYPPPNSYDMIEAQTYPDDDNGWDDTGVVTLGNLQLTSLSLNKEILTRDESRKRFFLVYDTLTNQYFTPIVFLAGFNRVVEADTNKPIKPQDILYDIINNEMIPLGTLSTVAAENLGSSNIIFEGRNLGNVHSKVLYIKQHNEFDPATMYSVLEPHPQTFYYGNHNRKERVPPKREGYAASVSRFFSRGGKFGKKTRNCKKVYTKYRRYNKRSR
jgi:hypothetical protein